MRWEEADTAVLQQPHHHPHLRHEPTPRSQGRLVGNSHASLGWPGSTLVSGRFGSGFSEQLLNPRVGQPENGGDIAEAESVFHEGLRRVSRELRGSFGESSDVCPRLGGFRDSVAGRVRKVHEVDDLRVAMALLEDGGPQLLLDRAEASPGGVDLGGLLYKGPPEEVLLALVASGEPFH